MENFTRQWRSYKITHKNNMYIICTELVMTHDADTIMATQCQGCLLSVSVHFYCKANIHGIPDKNGTNYGTLGVFCCAKSS